MDTGKAIFLGLALIALAIFATDAMRPAQAGANEIGRYNISGSTKSWAWIIDTSTGRYRKCSVDSGFTDGECEAWFSSQ